MAAADNSGAVRGGSGSTGTPANGNGSSGRRRVCIQRPSPCYNTTTNYSFPLSCRAHKAPVSSRD